MINKGRFASFLLNGIPDGIQKKKTAMSWDLPQEPTLCFWGFSSQIQEREMFTLHIAAPETEIFRPSISSQDMQVLFVSPLLSTGWVEGAVLVTLGVR